MVSRRVFVELVGLGSLGIACKPAAPPAPPGWMPRARSALEDAAEFLWSQQDSEGLFPSRVYGTMRRGQSTTPFVLLSLAEAGPAYVRPSAAGTALGALLAMRDAAGALGFAEEVADYPVYATSLMISAFARIRPAGWQERLAPSIAWLRTQQLLSADGWAGHSAQGGFGMGSQTRMVPPDPGHVDLSMTRRAIEALAAAGAPPTDPALIEGRAFVERCRAPDGGFIYSPVETALNKSPTAGDPPTNAGYGSATTDAVLALLATGAAKDDPLIAGGLDWLRAHHALDRNPGLDGGPMEAFGPAMRGYYRAGAAIVFARLGGPEGWRRALAEAVLAEQQPTGEWRNERALQREDDPLLATAFAATALSSVLLGD